MEPTDGLPKKRARSPATGLFVPADFEVPLCHTAGGLELRKLCAAMLDSDYEAVMGSAGKLTTVFAPADDWPLPTLTRADDLLDLRRHEAEFDRRLAFAFTVIPSAQAHLRLQQTLGCVYINPATRRGFDAEVLLWTVSHGLGAAEASTLEAKLDALVRQWMKDAWPFEAVAYPGRGATPWPVFEEMAWRDEAVPRIGADAQTVIQYNARACGLARC